MPKGIRFPETFIMIVRKNTLTYKINIEHIVFSVSDYHVGKKFFYTGPLRRLSRTGHHKFQRCCRAEAIWKPANDIEIH